MRTPLPLPLSLVLALVAALPLRADEKRPFDAARLKYIEVHAHISPAPAAGGRGPSFEASARVALAAMDRLGVRLAIVMPPPLAQDMRGKYDHAELERFLKGQARFAFLAGGGSLNPLIHEAAGAGRVADDARSRFDRAALEVTRSGARGFGELAALHFSYNQDHPFLACPPDHPLFLRLAEIAGREGLPIDLHVEAVARDGFPFPHDPHTRRSGRNPATLAATLPGLERLLAHDRKARLVWAHVGWDHTGDMTVALLLRLLAAHSNLYCSLKQHEHSLAANRPMDEQGKLKAEWLALFRAHPDRFVLGADMIWTPPVGGRRFPDSQDASRRLLNQLPEPLARKIGYENAVRIYKLDLKPADFEGDRAYQPAPR